MKDQMFTESSQNKNSLQQPSTFSTTIAKRKSSNSPKKTKLRSKQNSPLQANNTFYHNNQFRIMDQLNQIKAQGLIYTDLDQAHNLTSHSLKKTRYSIGGGNGEISTNFQKVQPLMNLTHMVQPITQQSEELSRGNNHIYCPTQESLLSNGKSNKHTKSLHGKAFGDEQLLIMKNDVSRINKGLKRKAGVLYRSNVPTASQAIVPRQLTSDYMVATQYRKGDHSNSNINELRKIKFKVQTPESVNYLDLHLLSPLSPWQQGQHNEDLLSVTEPKEETLDRSSHFKPTK